MTEKNNSTEETEIDHTTENLESVGQMLIGGIETIGGILTGDPVTRAEGEFNVETGSLHQESNRVLTAIEENEESNETNLESPNQS
ncbi:MAG TPA: hypothetical protein VF556_14220 [Pyrinomonadaceae bacterium]|jgi:hypothetical protein